MRAADPWTAATISLLLVRALALPGTARVQSCSDFHRVACGGWLSAFSRAAGAPMVREKACRVS